MLTGRSLKAKKELYQDLVANLGKLGILASDVFIIFHEVSLENWGICRGILASEIDLGENLYFYPRENIVADSPDKSGSINEQG
jgi:hypothetical protein